MGDGEVSNGFRERLERDVDGLQATLKQTNEKNKPVDQKGDGTNGLPIIGAAVGASLGGPVGALLGGILGGFIS